MSSHQPIYQQSVVQMSKMLRNLDAWLAKAEAFAAHKEISPDDFVSFRLAPDMRPLSFQVQAACDNGKYTAARLAGVDAPKHEDDETTMAQLRARVASTLEYLDGLDERQFEGAAEREVELGFLPGQACYGADYLCEMALPNFYFHLTTAYDLLRMAGVAVGKRDYIGSLTLHAV
jgi:hypothetical protein